MANKVERELRKATGVKKDPDQDQEKYLDNLMKKIGDLPETVWEGLSNEAQQWFNDAVEAEKDSKPIPPFPADVEDGEEGNGEEADDAEGEDGDGGEATEDGNKENEVASKKKGKGGDKTKSKAKPAKSEKTKEAKAKGEGKKKEPKEKKAKADGADKGERVEAVWDILLKNPKAKPEDVADKTKMQASTVKLAIGRFNRMLKYLDEKGLLKKSFSA